MSSPVKLIACDFSDLFALCVQEKQQHAYNYK